MAESAAVSGYNVENGRVWQEKEITGGKIIFIAEDIQKGKAGVYAKLHIASKNGNTPEPRMLTWSNLNVDRSPDRYRLGRDALKRAGDLLAKTYPENQLLEDLDKFCLRLYEASLTEFKAERLSGNLSTTGPSFLLKPFVMEGGGTILFAPPGRGKSYVGLIMSISMDAGCDDLWPTQQRNVMFINLERSQGSIEDRIGAINVALGLPSERELLVMSARGRSLQEIRHQAAKAVKEHKIDVIVLDSISRTGYGTLVEDKPANQIIDALNSLCPTWVALAHTPRSDEGHIFGSVMFDAGIDVGVQLITEQSDTLLGIGLKITKANDMKIPKEPDILALEFGDNGLTDIRRAHNGEFVHIESQQPQNSADRILEHLTDVGEDYGKSISEMLGIDPSLTTRILKTDKRIVRGKKEGNKIYYGARTRDEEY